MVDAAETVKPALEGFYASLTNEQKAQFNTLGRQAQRRELTEHTSRKESAGRAIRPPPFDFNACVTLYSAASCTFRRSLANPGVDFVLELAKLSWNIFYQRARGLVELFVLPGLHRIEQMRLDARHRCRHREAEIRIGADTMHSSANRRARR